MGQTTFCNMRGIAHKGSGGMSIAFPDVCKTPAPPAPPIPIPYPNIGQASDTLTGPEQRNNGRTNADGRKARSTRARQATKPGPLAASRQT